MKFGQLIEYPKRNIFLKNYAENETGKLVLVLFWFFKKAIHIYYVKANGLQLNFAIFQ